MLVLSFIEAVIVKKGIGNVDFFLTTIATSNCRGIMIPKEMYVLQSNFKKTSHEGKTFQKTLRITTAQKNG